MVGPWLDYGSADHGPTWPIVKIGPTWPNLAQRQPSWFMALGQQTFGKFVRDKNQQFLKQLRWPSGAPKNALRGSQRATEALVGQFRACGPTEIASTLVNRLTSAIGRAANCQSYCEACRRWVRGCAC